MIQKLLIINPGSTSSKLEYWSDESGSLKKESEAKIAHSTEELARYKGDNVLAQIDFRMNVIVKFIEEANIDIDALTAVVGRGGFLPKSKFQSGVYEVNEAMLEDLRTRALANHPCNLGAILAKKVCERTKNQINAYIMDPVIVDEMEEISRISGMKLLTNLSFFHALNQKATSRRCAKDLGKKYEDCNFIVAHLGGGISIGAHKKGKVVDVNNGMHGQGAFSPERSGSVDTRALIDLCFSKMYTKDEICKMNVGEGGLFSYLGTSDLIEVENRINNGDEYAKLIFDALILQISKYISYTAAVFKSNEPIDAIIITAGLAKSTPLIKGITERVERIAPIKIYPGELEGEALAEGVYLALNGEMEIKQY